MNGNDEFDNFFRQEEEKMEREKQQAQQTAQMNFSQPAPNAYPYGYQQYNINPDYALAHQRRAGRNKKIVIAVMLSIVMIAVFFLGMLVQDLAWSSKRKLISDVEKFIELYGYVFESDDPYEHDLYYQAAKAMLESIDPHSTLLTPEEYYAFMNDKPITDAAHGIYYTNHKMDYQVYEVSIGGPAYEAGLFAGDIVVGIEVGTMAGHAVVWGEKEQISYRTDVDTFLNAIRHNNIAVYVARDLDVNDYYDESKQIRIELEKSSFNERSVDYYFSSIHTNMSDPYKVRTLQGGDADGQNIIDGTDIGYIRFSTFMSLDTKGIEGPYSEFLDAMTMFKNLGKKKLILDLRNNGGGSTAVSSNMGGLLMYDKANPDAKNLVISKDKYKDGSVNNNLSNTITFTNYFSSGFTSPPIVVLTNENSASASEQLLAAMLDYGTCVQVGTTTYGKGIAQTILDVGPTKIIDGERWPYGAYMTVMEFFSPRGISHHKMGIKPLAENTVKGYSQQAARAVQILTEA